MRSKNVISEITAKEIIDRVLALTSETKGKWGVMTASEMLFHCNLTNNGILRATPYEKKPKLKQRILKIVVIHLLKKLPKEVKASTQFFKNENQDLNFDIEKQTFIETINRFANHTDAIYGKHPFFGRLTTKEWKRFVWMHMDHHLRQFGV